ncbi:hypothetical protein [Limnohabitans sp.]|uniref:hypothetical protein n=1 Tax=Limnohabitans sp. TaxID=1907725 RepID=UPI00286F4C65|nr:hypothetical protein [Limnohabitans sp.]
MTYTFFPVPPIDTLNDHSGLTIIYTILICSLLLCAKCGTDREFKNWFFFCVVVAAITAVISYNCGSVKTFKNVAVRGALIGFVAEGYNESRTSGKSTTRVDVHKTYVVYEIDGKQVIFNAQLGIEYPSVATLYRN